MTSTIQTCLNFVKSNVQTTCKVELLAILGLIVQALGDDGERRDIPHFDLGADDPTNISADEELGDVNLESP